MKATQQTCGSTHTVSTGNKMVRRPCESHAISPKRRKAQTSPHHNRMLRRAETFRHSDIQDDFDIEQRCGERTKQCSSDVLCPLPCSTRITELYCKFRDYWRTEHVTKSFFFCAAHESLSRSLQTQGSHPTLAEAFRQTGKERKVLLSRTAWLE